MGLRIKGGNPSEVKFKKGDILKSASGNILMLTDYNGCRSPAGALYAVILIGKAVGKCCWVYPKDCTLWTGTLECT